MSSLQDAIILKAASEMGYQVQHKQALEHKLKYSGLAIPKHVLQYFKNEAKIMIAFIEMDGRAQELQRKIQKISDELGALK